jgi:hypothetical protein
MRAVIGKSRKRFPVGPALRTSFSTGTCVSCKSIRLLLRQQDQRTRYARTGEMGMIAAHLGLASPIRSFLPFIHFSDVLRHRSQPSRSASPVGFFRTSGFRVIALAIPSISSGQNKDHSPRAQLFRRASEAATEFSWPLFVSDVHWQSFSRRSVVPSERWSFSRTANFTPP